MRHRLLPSLIAAALVSAPALARAQVAADRILNAASSATPCPAESCLEVPGVSNGVSVEITDTLSGTWTAQFEISLGGESWTALGLSTADASPATVSSATAAGKWRGAAGFRFRVRLSAYTTGQPRVKIVPLGVPPTSGGGGGSGTDPRVAQGSTTSGQTGSLIQGAVTTVAPTYTTATTNPFSLDVNGALRVAITSGAGSGGTALADRSGTFTPNSTSFTPTGGYMDDVASDACTEGAPCTFRVSSARALHTNLAQVAGATVATGNGTAAGAIRVALPTDGTGVVGLAAGAAVIGALTANQSVNVAQINGVTALMGNGVTGTGSQRVTIASDNTAFTVNAAQSGTWNVTNVSGTVSLPTGAATSANQSTEITSLQLIDDAVAVLGTATYTEATTTGYVMGGVRRDADTTLVNTTNEIAPFQVNAAGQLKVACITGCSGSTFVDNAAFTFGTTVVQPIAGVLDDTSTNAATENSAAVARITAQKALHVNLRTAAGVEITPSTDQTLDAALTTTGPLMVGRGSTATPTAMSTDNDATALWVDLNGRLHLAAEGVEDVAHVPSEAGMRLFARRLDTPATSSGSSGDWSTVDASPEGALYTTPIASAGISAGALTYAVQSAASTNSANVKASAGNVYGIHVVNTTATVYYLRLYNASGAPTCSSATGFVETIPIPASTTGAGISIAFPVGKAFTTGIAHCITGGGSSTDNTNAATGVYVGLEYR